MTKPYPDIERTLTCVECGGPARLIMPIPDDAVVAPGDVLIYRCADCGDRWDVVYEPDAVAGD